MFNFQTKKWVTKEFKPKNYKTQRENPTTAEVKEDAFERNSQTIGNLELLEMKMQSMASSHSN